MDDTGFAPGELIDGRYRVEGVLGRGGMGAVLRAHDLTRDLAVAVKVLPPEAALADDALARFEREAQAAARVDRGGGVVRVWSAGRHRGRAFIVMELVEGEELGALLERGVPPEELARLVASVARTVDGCHALGVVHRDLKPSNVLVRAADGQPLVADFGLAWAADALRLTRTGEILGTPVYMAPEQAADSSRAVGPRVDVYALGAILYRGLAGQPPFSGDLIGVLHRVLTEEPPAPSSLRPGVPAALEAVCRRAMAKAPDERYPSAAALADDLERWRAGGPVAAGRSRGRVVGLGLALLAVAAVVGVRQGHASLVAGSRADLEAAQAWRRQVLEPWAFGAGPGSPPSSADLAARADAVAAARDRLPPDEAAAAAELLAWVEGGRCALDGRAPAGAGVAADVVLALRLEATDPQAGAERLARAAPTPIGRHVEGRLWQAALRESKSGTPLRAYVDARDRLEPAAREACDARLEALVLDETLALAGRAARGDPAAVVSRALGHLPALPGGRPSAAKTSRFDEDADVWLRVLRAAWTTNAPRGRELLELLGAALRAWPPADGVGPVLRAGLATLETDLLTQAAERVTEPAVLVRAVDFDAVRGRVLGFEPPSARLQDVFSLRPANELKDPVLLLGALRCGFAPGNVDQTVREEQQAQLLLDRPASRAVRYLALRRQTRQLTESLLRERLARAILAPGLDEDLADRYVSDAHLELGRALVGLSREALAAGARDRAVALYEEAGGHLRRSIELIPESGGKFREAWTDVVAGAAVLHGYAASEELFAEGLRHVDEGEGRAPPGREQVEWAVARADLHLDRGRRALADGLRPLALAHARRAYAEVPRDHARTREALAFLGGLCLEDGRRAELEEELARLPMAALGSSALARIALRSAPSRAVAQERYEQAVRLGVPAADLAPVARALGLELR